MNIKRGEIYLVDFGKKYQSELGKIRPALVLQSDYVNDNLEVALRIAFKSATKRVYIRPPFRRYFL